jgi:RNA polymerase sigma-70 factor (ECF subfamily)
MLAVGQLVKLRRIVNPLLSRRNRLRHLKNFSTLFAGSQYVLLVIGGQALMIDCESESGSLAILLRDAKTGNLDAFEQIVKGHERTVLLTALRLLGRWEDAQDAAQEVFLRLHKYLKRFDDAREFAPWLYRVTVNVCRDLNARRRPDAELDALDVAPPDIAAGPHEQARSSEGRRILQAALGRLSERERAAVVLRDIEGLSTREVAQILGSTEATVRSHLSNARLKIMRLTERFRREES